MSTCPACGASLEGQWKFCLRCGARLPEETPAETASATDATAAVAATVEPVVAESAPVIVEVVPDPAPDSAPDSAPDPSPDAPPEEIPAAIRPAAAPAAVAPLNTLAIVALALGIIGGPVAIIFGHVALRQIRQTGERGRAVALVATVLGYVWLVAWAAVIAWVVVTGGR